MALGIPDGLYWQLTPPEVQTLARAFHEREEQREVNAYQRTAALLAEIRNSTRRKRTQKVWKAEDFFKLPNRRDPWAETQEEQRRDARALGPERAAETFRAWAAAHNQIHRA